jgi:hypothetical protein
MCLSPCSVGLRAGSLAHLDKVDDLDQQLTEPGVRQLPLTFVDSFHQEAATFETARAQGQSLTVRCTDDEATASLI